MDVKKSTKTIKQEKDVVTDELLAMTARLPSGWQEWSLNKTRAFKALVIEARAYAQRRTRTLAMLLHYKSVLRGYE